MAGVDAAETLAAARRIAEEVLLPAAAGTDAADMVPQSNLDALAAAGLYGIAGPGPDGAPDGGPALPPAAAALVAEALAGGCLTTTFVWMQHHTAVRAVAGAAPALRERWLARLCAGRVRAGIALGGLLGAEPLLRARPDGDGWLLDGESPWVTGWGRVDVLLTAARHGDQVVWSLLDAAPAPGLDAQPLRLVAVNASGTVTLRLSGYRVPPERVVGLEPHAQVMARDAARLRLNGSLALGVAARCCALLGPSPLDAALTAARAALRTVPDHELPAARAGASALAARAATALVAATGSRAVLTGQHAERLARESLFLLVFGSRPAIREALLHRLGAATVVDATRR
jgi:alkylation response protein AidB-like acyl-CoA dehydrogenase